MSVRVIFVRHGQSVANLQDFFYNDEDSPLTPLGREQAKDVGQRLKESGIKFDNLFCSTYERARETCRIALAEMGLDTKDVIIDRRLEERKFDGLIGQTASEEHYHDLFVYDSKQSEIDGVELLDDLEARAKSFIDDLKENYDGKTVLIFSHGCLGMAVYVVVNGRPECGSYFGIHLLNNCEYMDFTI